MTTYSISSRASGAEVWRGEASNPAQARLLMAMCAGYQSVEDMNEASADDGSHLIVTEMVEEAPVTRAEADSWGWGDRHESTWVWEGAVSGHRVRVVVDTAAGSASVQALDGGELDAEAREGALSATLLTMVEELRAAEGAGGTP